MPDVISIVVSFVSGSVGGAIAGATVAHFLAKRREADARIHADKIERANRKRHFLGFAVQWRDEINGPGTTINFVEYYASKRHEFVRECETIKSDLGSHRNQARFAELCNAVAVTGHLVGREDPPGNYIGRLKFIPALDAVIAFVKAN
jgi:glycine/D-amino acid oxidase-like deaminating enzyme